MKMQLISLLIATVASSAMAQVFDMGEFKDKSYKLYYGTENACESEAREVCCEAGGELAHIDSWNFSYIVKKMKKVPKVGHAYVDSWNGDNYGKTCIALYQGGSIVVPPEQCKGPTAFICEFEDCDL